jgi:hypothetical protein
MLQSPGPQYRPVEFKGYRFFLPKIMIRRKGKESEYQSKDTEGITFLIQVAEGQPVDYLSKMGEAKRNI